jgi:HSP20 family protein
MTMSDLTQMNKDNGKTPAAARNEAALMPPVDVVEDGTGITLYADLPGVPRDRLNLRVEGDQLTIEAEAVLAVPQGMEPTHAEVGLSRYRRAFTLSKELDPEKVAAELACCGCASPRPSTRSRVASPSTCAERARAARRHRPAPAQFGGPAGAAHCDAHPTSRR